MARVVVYRCLMLVEKKTNSKQMLDPNGNSGEELGHKKPSTRNPIGDERLAFKLSGCARGSFWGVCWVVRSIEIDRETDEIRWDRASRPAMRGARLSYFAPPRGHLGEEQHSDPGRGARSAIIFATWGDLEHYVHDYLSAIPTCQIRAARLGIVSGWACGDRRSVKNSPT